MSEKMMDQSNQLSEGILRESPLHYMTNTATADQSPKCGVVIQEQALRGHLNLRGDPDDEMFRSGAAEALGLELPFVPGTCINSPQVSVYWLGPNEWLIIVPGGGEEEVQRRLRQILSGRFSIVDVSGGQTLVKLSGPDVGNVLKKSSGYDFHPNCFAPGRCVQTTFAKATAVVSKNPDNSIELIIRRSFADYLFGWIVDAAREYGVEVKAENE